MKTIRCLRLLIAISTLGAVAFGQTAAPVAPVSPAIPQPATPGGPATVVAAPITPLSLPDPVLRPTGIMEQSPATGETALTLDVGNGIRFVPASRVTVPAGETLRVTGPGFGSHPVQWLKDGRPLAGATNRILSIASVRSSDAGTYQLSDTEPTGGAPVPSQALILGVGPTPRLLNISTRGDLAAGAGQTFIAGFVVAAGTGQAKKLILRAVGPSLASFGVTSPLRAPVLRVFDSAGKPYVNGYVYPAVVGGPTYESDLAESLAKTGAFPVPAGTLDAVVMMPFTPGAYTAQVTSGDNTAGTVLVEIYEVP